MKRTLPIFLHSYKTFIAVLLFAVSVTAMYSFAFPADAKAKIEVIKCYPNPATSFVNFEFEKGIDKSYVLQVYSFVGKKMAEAPVANSKITFTLDDYNRGIYVYQLRDKSGQTVKAGKFQVIK